MFEEKYFFEGQRSDEKTIFVLKQHPWVLSKSGFIGLILLIALIVSYYFYGFSKVTSITLVLFVIIAIIYGLYLWFVFNNTLYILTNQRLILMEQKGFFSRKISETELEKIQNLTVEIKGVVKTMLNFGNIKITTAGIDLNMMVENVQNPYQVQQQIAKHCQRLSNEPNPSPKRIIQ